ncbi:unnamed protein product [Brassica rapa]|uniref:Uncharacterized protein n=2 Tax=Brassica TaxID=3705 RepID=A0A8D9H795_BRACM|nr:unnamed protein product [Brassica napus]CAG7894333.1 unnamed protein product [Brassica rapa]
MCFCIGVVTTIMEDMRTKVAKDRMCMRNRVYKTVPSFYLFS